MPGTAVETVPGGLLDRLLATAEPDGLTAVRASMAAGAAARALSEVEAATDLDPVSRTAWRHFAWHARRLALPDGSAGLMLLTTPPRPRAQLVVRAEDWLVGRLLTDLRDTRATWQLLLVTPGGFTGPDGIASIEVARGRLGDRADLEGHLDLLAADQAARQGDRKLSETYLEAARQHLAAAGDEAGLAAAALVAGDLSAAALTSPLAWNTLLFAQPNGVAGELMDTVEAREFDGDDSDGAGDDEGVHAAAAAYDEAAARYAALDHRAGLAATRLRRAYLAVRDDRPAEAVTLTAAARDGFEAAGRPLDAAVAAVHAALASLAADRLPADAGVAARVVAAGLGDVGPGTALGLGLLCLRMGRHWAGAGQRPERATTAFGIAERIFGGLGEPRLCSQAAAARAEAAASVGDAAAVRVAIRAALAADDGPLTVPATPADPRRQRHAMLGVRLYVLADRIRDADGMRRAAAALDEAVAPLRAGLDDLTGLNRFLAEQLLRLAELPGRRVAELVYRAQAARDAGDPAQAEALLAEARAALDSAPPEARDFDEAILLGVAGERTPASAAFERYAARELGLVPAGSTEWRMIHVQGLAFQLGVGDTAAARSHHDALTGTAATWWAGIGEAWEHRALAGRLLDQEGDPAAAAAIFEQAVAEIEDKRRGLSRDEVKRSFFADGGVQAVYLHAVRNALRLASLGDAARWHAVAFGYAEHARARALLDLLAANVAIDDAGLPAALVARWRAAAADVTLARETDDSTVDAALARLDAVERELQQANPRFWSAVNPQAEPADLAAVVAALPAGVALLQYVTGPRDLVVWAVTRDGLVCPEPLHDDAGLPVTGLVNQMVEKCAGGAPTVAEVARELSDLLLRPLAAVIDASTSLLVAPAGPLTRLPFGALPWKGAPLIAGRAVTVLPSAGTLLLPQPDRPAGGRALVVGNPSGMVWQPLGADQPVPQVSLPAAGVEAWQVAQLLGDTDLLIGPAATAERVGELLPAAPEVHFATHGILEPRAPLAAAVLLADGGSLTAAQLFGRPLTAGLVVMSACHTGAGRVVPGDELLGLGRALLAAGARSAMVTLWAIMDVSAALLVSEFHRRRGPAVPDAEALRQAVHYLRTLDRETAAATFSEMAAQAAQAGLPALATLADEAARDVGGKPEKVPYAHPLHWAPFVLITSR